MPVVTKTIQVPMTAFEKKVEELKFPTIEEAVDFMRHELTHDLKFHGKRQYEISPADLKELLEFYLAIVTGSGK